MLEATEQIATPVIRDIMASLLDRKAHSASGIPFCGHFILTDLISGVVRLASHLAAT
jgi:hypothetical protein